MSDSLRRQMELFEAALDLPPEQREAFLRQECGQDTRLLEAVLGQLAADAKLGPEPAEQPVDPIIGSTIGPYRVKSLLGEGGYGSVYLAERQAPMVQQVALKIIRAGRDSKSVLARFDQERQALALMDHPNIARVFDAGSTPDGRPYFVMEYVAGEPITEYCDSNRLTVAQRLELFISICEAVQHAHQKAIIHRDLKPRNILVSQVDGKPVAKVIDFGIAKATGERLIDQTIETMQGIAVGTLLYMSPEQADGGKQDVDTRSDVYSLGVVLYELLAGILPHDAQTLLAAGQAEMHRIIREVDPPTPSTRLETIDGQTGTAIGTARGEDRSRLASQLRKELEWIPMMALRKDRARRYGSAAAMAADVRRYLEGKPLDAAPESRAYLVRKFVRRNRVVVGAVTAVVVSLAAGLGLAVTQRNAAVIAQGRESQQRAEADRQRRVAERVSGFVIDELLGAAEPSAQPGRGRSVRVREVLDRVSLSLDATASSGGPFAGEPIIEAGVRRAIGNTYRALGLPLVAEPHLTRAVELARAVDPDSDFVQRAMVDRANTLSRLARSGEAEAILSRVIPDISARLGPASEAALHARGLLGDVLVKQRKLDRADEVLGAAREDSEASLGKSHAVTLSIMNSQASAASTRGMGVRVEQLQREVHARRAELLGADHPQTLETAIRLSWTLVELRRYDDAAQFIEGLMHDVKRVFGETHRSTFDVINTLGGLARARGELDAAERWWTAARAGFEAIDGPEGVDTLRATNNLALVAEEKGRTDEAMASYRVVLDGLRRQLGEDDDLTLTASSNVARLLWRQGKLDQAEPLLADVAERSRRVYGPDHEQLGRNLTAVVGVNRQLGHLDVAARAAKEAHRIMTVRFGAEHTNAKMMARMVSDVYLQWDGVAPGRGHQETAKEWRAISDDPEMKWVR